MKTRYENAITVINLGVPAFDMHIVSDCEERWSLERADNHRIHPSLSGYLNPYNLLSSLIYEGVSVKNDYIENESMQQFREDCMEFQANIIFFKTEKSA